MIILLFYQIIILYLIEIILIYKYHINYFFHFIFCFINKVLSYEIKIITKIKYFLWGLGIGDWGLGIGDWAQSPIQIGRAHV